MRHLLATFYTKLTEMFSQDQTLFMQQLENFLKILSTVHIHLAACQTMKITQRFWFARG